jgi:stearoyl-CoA desaturase (delta-9 desaturase)
MGYSARASYRTRAHSCSPQRTTSSPCLVRRARRVRIAQPLKSGAFTGITAGYHRLFSHRSYTATPLLRAALLLAGAAAVQGSALWWARTHRAHHRFADAPGDPYSITKGLLHAHLGWVLLREDNVDPAVREGRERRKVIKVADLTKDPLVCWQHICYFPLALVMGFALPAAIPGLAWGDWRGGWYAAALARLFFVHHVDPSTSCRRSLVADDSAQCTFAINSLAHWFGSAPYDDDQSARDSVLSALLTLGEGYHNFHHEFPTDYRNAVHWMVCSQSAPRSLTARSLTVRRVSTPQSGLSQPVPCCVSRRASVVRRRTRSRRARSRCALRPQPPSKPRCRGRGREESSRSGRGTIVRLPRTFTRMRPADARAVCACAAQPERVLLLVAGYIHDATAFVSQHPGGAPVLRAVAARGADATTRFFGDGDIGKEGGGYRHSSAAQNVSSSAFE